MPESSSTIPSKKRDWNQIALRFLILLAFLSLIGFAIFIWYTSREQITELKQQLITAKQEVENIEEEEAQTVPEITEEDNQSGCPEQTIENAPVKFTLPCNWSINLVNRDFTSSPSPAGATNYIVGRLANGPLIFLYATEGETTDIGIFTYKMSTPNAIDTEIATYRFAGEVATFSTFTTTSGLTVHVMDSATAPEPFDRYDIYLLGKNTPDGGSFVTRFTLNQPSDEDILRNQLLESFEWIEEE